jgi:hypothetical protein
MKSGFQDRTAIKNQKPKDEQIDGKNSPWDWRCPQYDQRSSCFIKAGTDYGIGIRQPVGTENASGMSPIPFGKVNTMKVDET